MRILIDNGHGHDTPGKRSPDGRLLEYAYTREIAVRVVAALRNRGYNAERIVTETSDVKISERCRRVNMICKTLGAKNVLLVSIHNNAAGSNGQWKQARGWSVHMSKAASENSKVLARCLVEAAEQQGMRVRYYNGKREPWWTQPLGICRNSMCPAVLTENLFQDNRDDVDYMLSEEGKNAITMLHVNGIITYIEKMK